MEKLVERVEQISAKLDILDEIERKMNKLDSIEEKMKKFSSRLSNIEKSVSSLRCEVNSYVYICDLSRTNVPYGICSNG